MAKPMISGQTAYIRYDPERVDYTLTEHELRELQSAAQNSMKDFCLVTASTAIPCIINGIAMTPSPFQVSLALFLNYLIGGICLLGAIVFGILWKKSASNLKRLVQSIREKPKMAIQITSAGGSSSSTVLISRSSDTKDT